MFEVDVEGSSRWSVLSVETVENQPGGAYRRPVCGLTVVGRDLNKKDRGSCRSDLVGILVSRRCLVLSSR